MYCIQFTTPTRTYRLPFSFYTMKEARDYLASVLKNYKKDTPRGEKRRNRWYDRYTILCRQGSDDHHFTLKKKD